MPLSARLTPFFLACLMAVLLLPFMTAATVNVDELDELYNGLRQVQGEVIYRDFFDFVPPLPQWLAAAVFGGLGPSLWAMRLLQGLVTMVSGLALYQLARRFELPPPAAAVPALLLVTALFRAYPVYYHHWLALACALAGLLAVQTRPGLAGLAAGAALLCTQTDGLVALGTLGVVLLYERGPRVRLAWLALGFALPPALAAAWLASQGALAAAWSDVWLWPLTHYKTPGGFNDVGLLADFQIQLPVIRQDAGTPFGLARVVWLAGLALLHPLGILAGVALVRRNPSGLAVGALVLAVGQLAACLAGRADHIHLAMYAVPATLLACVGAWHRQLRGGSEGQRWLPHVALAALALAGLALTGRAAQLHPEQWLVAAPPDGRLAAMPVIARIKAHTAEGDRIVSLPWGGYHYFYARPAATRHTLMLPPSFRYNSADEYAQLRQEIITRRPRLVVLQLPGPVEFLAQSFPDLPPPGYRLVESVPTPIGPKLFNAYLFERVD